MKLKVALIATLLAIFMVAPALADADITYYTDPAILNDDSGIQIEVTSVIVSDLPDGSIGFSHPSELYRFYKVHYVLANPTDHEIRYQLNLTFKDSNGVTYTPESENLAQGLGAGIRVTDEMKEYAIPRSSTGVYMRWTHLNKYLNVYEYDNLQLKTQPVTTPTPTPTPTIKATPTPTPTPTPKQTPVGGLLPVLAIGIVASGFVAYSIRNERRK